MKNRGMVKWINLNTYLFVLIFETYVTYIYSSVFLHLQTNRACIACPVESESGDQ